MGWRLVNEVRHYDKSNIYYFNKMSFNLCKKAEIELYNAFNETSNLQFQTSSEIMQYSVFKTFSDAISNNSLKIEGKSWENVIDIKFFKNSLFIKILLYVYKNNGLSDYVIKKIINNIDYNDPYLGKNIQNFVQKNKDKISKNRPEMITVLSKKYIEISPLKFDSNISLLSRDDLKNKNAEEIVDLLSNPIHRKSTYDFKKYIEKNVTGTIDLIRRIISGNDNSLDNKVAHIFINNIDKLFNEYKTIYFDFIRQSKSYVEELSHKIIGYYTNGYDNKFDPYDQNILEKLVESEKYREDILLYLNDFDFSKLSRPRETGMNDPILNFIESEMGQYFILLEKASGNNTNILLNKIKMLDDKNLKCFMIGRHFMEFPKKEFSDYYTFVGFSSAYGVRDIEIHLFTNLLKN